MKPYSAEIVINLPRDRVIELFDNSENMFKWQPGLQSFEHVSGEPGQPGAKSKLVYLNGKHRVEMIETVVKRDFPNEFTGTYEFEGGKNSLENYFSELGPDRTLWKFTSDFQFCTFMMKAMGFFFPGMFRKQSMTFLQHFKEFAEHGKDVREDPSAKACAS